MKLSTIFPDLLNSANVKFRKNNSRMLEMNREEDLLNFSHLLEWEEEEGRGGAGTIMP